MIPRIRKQTSYEGTVSRTQQCFKSSCNIQEIINRAKRTGQMPLGQKNGFFGDFAGVDFQSMQNLVASAQQGFDALSPAIRRRFHNNPAELIEFVEDENNRSEAVKLGLVPDRVTVPPLDVTVTSDTVTPPVPPKEETK